MPGKLSCWQREMEKNAWVKTRLTNKVQIDRPYLLFRYWAGAICYGRVHARRAMARTGVEMSSKHCHILKKSLKMKSLEKSDLSPQVLEYLTPEDKIAILT